MILTGKIYLLGGGLREMFPVGTVQVDDPAIAIKPESSPVASSFHSS